MTKQERLDAIHSKCKAACGYLDDPSNCQQWQCPLYAAATSPDTVTNNRLEGDITSFCMRCASTRDNCDGCELRPVSPVIWEDAPQPQERPQYRRIRRHTLTCSPQCLH